MAEKKRKTVALALGSGGSKGLSHIGVIKELERNNIPIDMIVGASIGALIGGVYAATKDIAKIEHLALKTNWQQLLPIFFDPVLRKGIVRGDKLKTFIRETTGATFFEDLQIPFGAVVTDLSDAKALCLTTGDFPTAIRASISVPILFHPVIVDNKLLVDGGLSVPVPVEFARAMGADIVIAVNLMEHYEGLFMDKKFGINEVTFKSTDVMGHYLALENVKTADIVISPNVGTATLLNKFLSRQGTKDVIYEGELATHAKIPRIKNLLRDQSVYERVFSRIKGIFE